MVTRRNLRSKSATRRNLRRKRGGMGEAQDATAPPLSPVAGNATVYGGRATAPPLSPFAEHATVYGGIATAPPLSPVAGNATVYGGRATAPPLSPDDSFHEQNQQRLKQIEWACHTNRISILDLINKYNQLKASVEHNDRSLGRLYARLLPDEQV